MMLDEYKDEFNDIYMLALYDLSQMKLKKSYSREAAKLVQHITEPTDDNVLEALCEKYSKMASGKVIRRYDMLCRKGAIVNPDWE